MAPTGGAPSFSGSSAATSGTGDQASQNAFWFNSGSQQTNSLPTVAILAGALILAAVLLRKR